MGKDKILAPELEEGEVNKNVSENAVDEEVKDQVGGNGDKHEEEESLADSVRVVSPGRLVAKRFFRSRLSMVGLITLIVLFAFAFIGPVFSPWGENEMDPNEPEDIRESFNIITKYDSVSEDVIKEYGSELVDTENKVYKLNHTGDYESVFGDIDVYYIEKVLTEYEQSDGSTVKCYYRTDSGGEYLEVEVVEYNWDRKTFNQLGKVDGRHWLGTDERGYDVFTRLMYGGRISLTIGFVVVILETVLGVIFGGLAGYFGKWVDQLIMRIVDVFNCVPTFPILLILSAVLDGTGVADKYRIYYLLVMMTLLGWSGIARVVRGQILYLREQEYMVAAEALGLSVPRKIFRHLLPNILPQLIVQMTLGLGGIILTESTLSYLGIGVPSGQAAWGSMIGAARKPEILQGYPNLWVPAGICIVLAVLAFNFVGDGLRDAFDPKASR